MNENCTICNPRLNYACDECREKLYKTLWPDHGPKPEPPNRLQESMAICRDYPENAGHKTIGCVPPCRKCGSSDCWDAYLTWERGIGIYRERTVEEILTGEAIVWANMPVENLRMEHEQLRRALKNARAQIAYWSPIVAWRHRCPKCQDQRLSCATCGDPW